MAAHATVPVINALTKQSHPCQVLADLMTFEEKRGSIRGRKIAWSGDYNNVLSSWIDASARFDFRLEIACPPELQPGKQRLEAARKAGANIAIGVDPVAAAQRRGGGHLRLLGVDGRRGRGPAPQSARALSGQRQAHEPRRGGRHLHALPARPSRRGGDGRSDRRPAIGRVRRSGKPPARAERRARLVSWSRRHDCARARRLGRGRRRHRAAVRRRILEHARPSCAPWAGDRSASQAPRLSRSRCRSWWRRR